MRYGPIIHLKAPKLPQIANVEARTSAVSVNRALVDWEDNSFPNLWFRYYEEYNGGQIASLYSVLLGSSAIITPAEREAMFVRFSETRDLVHRTAYGLTPQQLQYRPDASCWSVAENLEHITISVLPESTALPEASSFLAAT